MNTITVDQLIQSARRLSPVERLHLVSVLYEELRSHLAPRVVSLAGRWAGLSFAEEGMEKDLQELHQQSWQRLETEIDE